MISAAGTRPRRHEVEDTVQNSVMASSGREAEVQSQISSQDTALKQLTSQGQLPESSIGKRK